MSIKDEAVRLHNAMLADAQDRFIKFVMEEEGIDWSTAYAVCEGRTETRELCYIVAFKLCDPALQKAMSNKRTRAKAIAAFEKTLPLDELIYYRTVILPEDPDGQKWAKAYEEEAKKAKKNKKNIPK